MPPTASILFRFRERSPGIGRACSYVSVTKLARGNPAALPAAVGGARVTLQSGGRAVTRYSSQDAGDTTQNTTVKAASPVNLFNLPMILHGRDACATRKGSAQTPLRLANLASKTQPHSFGCGYV